MMTEPKNRYLFPFLLFMLFFKNSPADTWLLQNPPPSTLSLTNLCIPDSNHLVVLADSGTILITTNSGLTWEKQEKVHNIAEKFIYAFFEDTATGIVFTNTGRSVKTIDCGNSWDLISDSVISSFSSPSFVNSHVGWAFGEFNRIIRTYNAGEVWENTAYSPLTFDLNSIFFIDSLKGWAVGNNGKILYSENGGDSWSGQESNTTNHLYTIYFLDSLNGWAGGKFGSLVCTDDGGQNWWPLPTLNILSVESLAFSDSLNQFLLRTKIFRYGLK